jgi:hypothetical protein
MMIRFARINSSCQKFVWSFWWSDVRKFVDNFRGVVAVKHGKGDTFAYKT